MEEFGHARVTAKHQTPDGFKLGSWLVVQRQTLDKLSEDQIKHLEKLGFDWNPKKSAREGGFIPQELHH